MARNIEIKAHVRDFYDIMIRLEGLADGPAKIISQEDIFFRSSYGRIKIRIIACESAQLIFYDRPDTSSPKRSEYHILEVEDPVALKRILESAFGVRGSVRKVRYLYTIGQTRAHVDTVKGLKGWFLELEIVLGHGQSDEEGVKIAKAFMVKLGVSKSDLLEGSYLDMIESRA